MDSPFHVNHFYFPSLILSSVLDTTRQPRHGEINGVAYNFVTEDGFKSLIASNSFLEHANFSGNWYGTSWSAISKVTDSDKICILDVDLAGVKSIKSYININEEDLKARYIFVSPPCKINLEERLRGRGSETEESLKKRLSRVDADFEYANSKGNYDLNLINDEFDSAYGKLVEFIFEIEETTQ